MKIKRLDIIGFKSFVDRITLDFPPGITAVVGPNGCGKSNIVDAIRWVMGEQSAKNLRGRQMEDVIFGGSELRKPLGMAEVTLTFSAEDGRMPARYLNYSEIQVTRRLYRDGESEYLLNKTPCRLLDIHELFMDTGVGAKAYSIIEQGKIGLILHAKPEERRFLIEEAAGVTKFKARKQVALKKIEVTRQNLLRLGDVIGEIRRQLNSLQRQAKRAEKFRWLREELREIELHLAARHYRSLEVERDQVGRQLAELESQGADRALQLERDELVLAQQRLELAEAEQRVAAAQEETYQLRGELQAGENRRDFQRHEVQALGRQRERFAEELARLEGQLAETERDRQALEEQTGACQVEAAGEEASLQVREQELEALAVAERAASARVEESRRQLFSLQAEIAQWTNQHSAVTKRLAGIAERLERSRSEGVALRERLTTAGGQAEQVTATLRSLTSAKEQLQVEQGALGCREEELQGRLAVLDETLAAVRQSLSDREARLRSLQELEAQFAGYGQGVRTLLLAERFRGRFQGVLADVIETDERGEAALEAVLGERLQYVVGASEADAVAAIAHLKETAGGRCTFLLPGVAAFPPAAAPAGAVALGELVRAQEGSADLVAALLTGVYLVDDLAIALAQARSFPAATFVTPDGDLVQAGGIAHGGSPEAVRQGLIHKKREIKDLTREVAGLRERLAEQEAERGRCYRDQATVRAELQDRRQRLHQTEMQLLSGDKDLQRVREECRQLEERLALREMDDAQLGEERAELERELAESGRSAAAAEERKVDVESELQRLQEGQASQRGGIEVLREVVTGLKVRVAALREKREADQRAQLKAAERSAELTARLAAHRQELLKTEQEREDLTAALVAGEAALRALLDRREAVEGAFAAVRQRFEEEAAVLQETEGRLKELRSATDELRRRQGEKTLQFAELSLRRDHLEESLRDRHRVSPAEVLSRYAELPCDEEAMARRQTELQQQIDELGEVSLTAIDECRALEERHAFLATQRDDLEESLGSLQKAIQKINRTTRRRFLETFQQVNATFQEVFPRLFCGGRAELRLTNEEDLLETGIEIIVQPPGKKLQNVSLLSGGEKALTAVALIFAIFLVKPSPFCLLDEVDAPLDDANIGRFNEMIREMSSFSQFILITHSKTTMMVADTLYGITMEEPGASKMVSVRLS